MLFLRCCRNGLDRFPVPEGQGISATPAGNFFATARKSSISPGTAPSRTFMGDNAFEWDDARAAANYARHGVTFDAACDVFKDAFAIEQVDDPARSHFIIPITTRPSRTARRRGGRSQQLQPQRRAAVVIVLDTGGDGDARSLAMTSSSACLAPSVATSQPSVSMNAGFSGRMAGGGGAYIQAMAGRLEHACSLATSAS